MTPLTLIQAALLSLLAVLGAYAATDPPPCTETRAEAPCTL